MLLQEGSCILRSSWPSGLNVFSKKALQHPHLIRISNACLLFLWRHLLFGSFDFFILVSVVIYLFLVTVRITSDAA